MKTSVKNIYTGIILLFTLSCSDNFLQENPEFDYYNPTVESNIYISPEWSSDEYQIHYAGIDNANFSIVDAPEWLEISTVTGQFTDGIAYVKCKANTYGEFSEPGIYNSILTIDVEGKGKKGVPVAYVNEGNPEIGYDENLKFSYNSYYGGYEQPLYIRNKGNGILIWDIVEYPKWVTVQYNDEYMTNNILVPYSENSNVIISLNTELSVTGNNHGELVIASNDKNNKLVKINIDFDSGYPFLECNPDVIYLGNRNDNNVLYLYNRGDGILVWKIENCPEWLTPSYSSGHLDSYNSEYITFSYNENNLPTDSNSTVINIHTNNINQPVYPITVMWSVPDYDNVKAIDGRITDAWLDKSTDILYLTTSMPNKLIAYDVGQRKIDRELALSKAPNCFSVSGDGHKAIIGHGGLISYVDMDNFTVTKTIEVDNIVWDIELANNDLCCYTEKESSGWSYLFWVNLSTNEKSKSLTDLYYGSILKRIPNQDYIIVSEINLSSGVSVFDANTKELLNDIFVSFDYFWFTGDGNYLFDSYSNVYRTSNLPTQSEISAIGQLEREEYYYYYPLWIEHSAATNSVWGVAQNSTTIKQFEDTDYMLVKSYYYDDFYVTGSNGKTVEKQVEARYLFVNSSGTELIVIKTATDDSNIWAIEFIAVN
jgi:hypothetical protein